MPSRLLLVLACTYGAHSRLCIRTHGKCLIRCHRSDLSLSNQAVFVFENTTSAGAADYATSQGYRLEHISIAEIAGARVLQPSNLNSALDDFTLWPGERGPASVASLLVQSRKTRLGTEQLNLTQVTRGRSRGKRTVDNFKGRCTACVRASSLVLILFVPFSYSAGHCRPAMICILGT